MYIYLYVCILWLYLDAEVLVLPPVVLPQDSVFVGWVAHVDVVARRWPPDLGTQRVGAHGLGSTRYIYIYIYIYICIYICMYAYV